MANEKDFKPAKVESTTTKTEGDGPDALHVPVGGQPGPSKHVTYQDMEDNKKVEHADCDVIWDRVISALEKGLGDAPQGHSKGARSLRNHLTVWLHHAKQEKGKVG